MCLLQSTNCLFFSIKIPSSKYSDHYQIFVYSFIVDTHELFIFIEFKGEYYSKA